MMAPGLPEIATKYAITNSSVVALSLSIFLLAYAIGVSMVIFAFILNHLLTWLTIAPLPRSSIGNVWKNLGEHLSDLITNFFFILIPSSQLLHIGNICTLCFNVGCAYAPTTGALIGFRLLCM